MKIKEGEHPRLHCLLLISRERENAEEGEIQMKPRRGPRVGWDLFSIDVSLICKKQRGNKNNKGTPKGGHPKRGQTLCETSENKNQGKRSIPTVKQNNSKNVNRINKKTNSDSRTQTKCIQMYNILHLQSCAFDEI